MRDGIPELFEFHGQFWDVDKALTFGADVQTERPVIDEALAKEAGSEDIDVDRDWAATHADLSKPVLVIPLPPEVFWSGAGDLVIDGWHRIARAIRQGVGELPARFLTPSDERACRVEETWDTLSTFEPWHAVRGTVTRSVTR